MIDHGQSPKYMADEAFRLRAKKRSALAFCPIEEVAMEYERLENASDVNEPGFVGYFEATYIGRCVADGGRNPLFGQAICNVESRMTLGLLRENNAFESFRDACSSGVTQASRPAVYRFVQSMKLQQYISRGATRAPRCSATTDRPRDRRNRAGSLERSRKETRGEERAPSEHHHPVPGA